MTSAGQDAPNLGLATTQELIDEITARIRVDGANGGGGLDYRTVGAVDAPPNDQTVWKR